MLVDEFRQPISGLSCHFTARAKPWMEGAHVNFGIRSSAPRTESFGTNTGIAIQVSSKKCLGAGITNLYGRLSHACSGTSCWVPVQSIAGPSWYRYSQHPEGDSPALVC
ncbi:unnamed protein product [Tuber aestivum]|uniref:Uncharacterized protein n=1 Tax=Tuber aestivum TaxID=59557 RepID=A0A292Q1P8_9PEZI|nr:unnamed protein product [Tuber aestivum]